MIAQAYGGELFQHCTNVTFDEATANACLIAVAPELYATLKSVNNLLGSVVDRGEQGWFWQQEECDKIDRVLAKARGEL